MSVPLDAVPDGSGVLIDANIFIYGITNPSLQCKNFLTRCSNEQVFGITLFEVVNNSTHAFMLAEGLEKRLAPNKITEFLQKKRDEVKKLTAYWANTERLLALNLLFLSL